jgi:peptide-methionine (S)-S-oxide reductase
LSEDTTRSRSLATLGGGCFWCLEAVYDELRGVTSVQSGYAGGNVVNPTYEQVCTGTTGHAEVTQITFDPALIAFDDLLDVFFTIHDPTTRDRQGNDVGPQYRSIILYHDLAQRDAAKRKIAEQEASGHYSRPIVTEVQQLGTFYPAEAYHTDYFVRNRERSYCQFVVSPKVMKARHAFSTKLRAGVA